MKLVILVAALAVAEANIIKDDKMGVILKNNTNGGGCTFPEDWSGLWFQSGYPGLIAINGTHILYKGECSDSEPSDKFLLYDRSDDCYRCLVIRQKHKYVLQYKEYFWESTLNDCHQVIETGTNGSTETFEINATNSQTHPAYCWPKDLLSAIICESISEDAPLYSMFRKEPRPVLESCPFRPAPFTFTYNRGSGDCANPTSIAETCTDDSRLLLRYMACPDVPGTESHVDELLCLATWKERSNLYLVGQFSQQRWYSRLSDEDSFRCFIYKGEHSEKGVTYYIAQSGDATCNGLSSPTNGSRTMKLINSDDEHNHCHFPSWILEHYKWFSLDHTHQYLFTTTNTTLKVMKDGRTEKRLVCHSILENKENKLVKLVAHVTMGCQSGHVCLTLYRRANGVLELQQGAGLWEAPQHACQPAAAPSQPLTITATSLHPMRCPIMGRYSVVSSLLDRRRRLQQITIGDDENEKEEIREECTQRGREVESVSAGCDAAQDTIEFKSACSSTVYTCYGSWMSDGVGRVIVAPSRGGSQPRSYCLVYSHHQSNETGHDDAAQYLSLSVVGSSCDLSASPGQAGDRAYNLTIDGTCEQKSKCNYLDQHALPSAILFLVTSLNGCISFWLCLLFVI